MSCMAKKDTFLKRIEDNSSKNLLYSAVILCFIFHDLLTTTVVNDQYFYYASYESC